MGEPGRSGVRAVIPGQIWLWQDEGTLHQVERVCANGCDEHAVNGSHVHYTDGKWDMEAVVLENHRWVATAPVADRPTPTPSLTNPQRAAPTREERLLDALIWCSGSSDFAEGGQAREGWLKLCAPLLDGATGNPQRAEGEAPGLEFLGMRAGQTWRRNDDAGTYVIKSICATACPAMRPYGPQAHAHFVDDKGEEDNAPVGWLTKNCTLVTPSAPATPVALHSEQLPDADVWGWECHRCGYKVESVDEEGFREDRLRHLAEEHLGVAPAATPVAGGAAPGLHQCVCTLPGGECVCPIPRGREYHAIGNPPRAVVEAVATEYKRLRLDRRPAPAASSESAGRREPCPPGNGCFCDPSAPAVPVEGEGLRRTMEGAVFGALAGEAIQVRTPGGSWQDFSADDEHWTPRGLASVEFRLRPSPVPAAVPGGGFLDELYREFFSPVPSAQTMGERVRGLMERVAKEAARIVRTRQGFAQHWLDVIAETIERELLGSTPSSGKAAGGGE